jgi:hypothetical protein
MKIVTTDIVNALAPLGVRLQTRGSEVALLKRSSVQDLFEQLEFVLVGAAQETIAISVALTAVQHLGLGFRGLAERDGWPEVCSDKENARVAFQTIADWQVWLRRVAEVAPERLERLQRERATALLARTKDAREYTRMVFGLIAERGIGAALESPLENLTDDQTRMVESVVRLPLVMASEKWRRAYELAVAAMIHAGDEAVLAQVLGTPTPIGKIARLGSVPNELMWRVRLLVDRILAATEE